MARIEIDHVEKVYPHGRVALRCLTLEVGDGELLVLVGPSGCGKSTALRLIAGLETPTRGAIRIAGRDVTGLTPQDRDVAMVFQSYALYPHMTVRENLGFGLRMRRRPAAEISRRVGDVAGMLGLEGLLDRRPAELSGGQRQRVALGRALAREPRAFLLDEPLSNLDAKLRVETRAELARLHRKLGATMVYVTHDQEEAMTLGGRVAVLHEGALQQVAPPMELWRHPANRFVAGFIGSPSMNFLEGALRPRPTSDGWVFAGRAATIPVEPPAGASEGMPVLLGVRPQEAGLETGDAVGSGDRSGLVQAEVVLVEPLGSFQLVHCAAAGGERLIVQAPATLEVEVDRPVRLRFPPEAIHLFGREDGTRLQGAGGRRDAGG